MAGGELSLEPTLLQLGPGAPPKRLSFRVSGLDAPQFVARSGFDQVAVSGIFEGVLPIVVDAGGARIVGGRLVARDPGGTLSYTGVLQREKIGLFPSIAFDALRSLRFSRLELELDGELAGELVTRIRLDGVNRVGRPRSFLARRIPNLPFRFNIRINAPFRALLATVRSIDDPRALIEGAIPPALEPVEPAGIQSRESGQRSEGE